MQVRNVFVATCVVLATLLAAYLIYQLAELLAVFFVAVIFASTVRPVMEVMRRYRIPSWLAILLIYVAAAASIIAMITLAIPPIVSLTMETFQDSSVMSKINYSLMRTGLAFQRQFEVYIPVMTLPTQFREFTQLADQTMQEQAWPMASNAAYVISQIFVAVVMSIYWLTARQSALQSLLRISPRQYQSAVRRIWIDTEEVLGAYFRGQIILALMIGAASFIGLTLLRVPNAFSLAVVAGLLEFVPLIGPIVAAVPAILIGLTVSPLTALLVAAWYLGVQQVEGNYLIPKVMSRGMSMHPLVVLVAIFAGLQLNGILGALLAVPIAGVLQVLVRHLPTAASESKEKAILVPPSQTETLAVEAS